jgi:hypothetical protein
MKKCPYCGAEYPDNTQFCRVDQTALAGTQGNKQHPDEIEEAIISPISDLSELNMGYVVEEGFSRPDWKAIGQFVRDHVPGDDLSVTWNYITEKWLKTLAEDLGGDSCVHQSQSFFCLSDLEFNTTKSLLNYVETAEDVIRDILKQAAWSGYHGKHVLLLFSDPDDYFAYISYYYHEGSHALSGGVFIRRGYAHIAFPYVNALFAEHVVAHELVHNLLCHLPIPLWLNEGLATSIESQVVRQPHIVDRELVDRHCAHWKEANIQTFWAGKSFDVPGEESQLSYSLSQILVKLLSEKGTPFIEFVRHADWRDAGQDAALNFLAQDLGEVLGEFLGPGNWRPQRKAISILLKTKPW